MARLAARGDGVTESGTFVPGAVPGDLVHEDGRIEPGPHRREPPCRHFGTCGACQLQHADDEVLGAFARGRIESALAKSGIAPGAVARTHISPPRSRRRASLRAQTRGGRLSLGFNEESSRTVVDIEECHVLTPGLFCLLGALREPLSAALPADWISSLTLTETLNGYDMLMTNMSPERARRAFSPVWMERAGVARISVEDRGAAEPLFQRDLPMVAFDGQGVAFPAGSFLQATADGEAALQAAVLDFAKGAGRVADLFCGLGTFALPLARRAKVTAADAAGPAIEALKQAAGAGGFNLGADHRDLFRRPYTAKELKSFDCVVVDPPRAGARIQCETAAASNLERFVYVSCNPSTFARDAEILVAGGFRLEELRPVAQFRWSTHVELAANFVR
ncbi:MULTISPECIES: class I SAM-dependent RNA methyltransferase [Pacificimonas]|uniref:class I SAM-dependent RNA methyltransferase n=1 Tax=Pacificimonas TaxID=1960290 RepID=UPI001CCD2384|nr:MULTISPECIES: methyltransferase [Pacificimonas]